MAGQVGKLTLDLDIAGFESVQELGKGLKQIAKLAERTDKEFLKARKTVNDFAASNRTSVTAIRGQIVALDKLKQSAIIGGKAYKALSKDIVTLNTQLLTLSNTEKIAQQAAASSALVERDAAGFRMDDKRFNRDKTQLLSIKELMGQGAHGGTFVRKQEVLDQRMASFAEAMKSMGVSSDNYKAALDKLTTTTRGFNEAQIQSTNIVRNQQAMSQVGSDIAKRRVAGQSPYSITRDSPSPMSMQGPWDVGQHKRDYASKGYWEKFFKNFAHSYLGYTSEDLGKALQDVVIPPALPGARSGINAGQLAGAPFTDDPFRNILQTTASYRSEIAKLDDQLENLTHGSEQYQTVEKQKLKLEKELAAATKETINAERKGFRTDRRTRGRGQVYRDPSTGAMIGGGQSFALPSGVESGAMQTVQSLKDFVAEQEKLNVTGKSNINTLTKTRSKFEEIRNTLDPTSKQFRQVTKAIAATDKALLRLSNNKFSGQNLRRTGQSILGAGFVGGPAGFLGAGVGAGIEALRPGGDMAGGAITGGLVASQVLTPVSQAIGGSTTYASDIEKANIALRGITKTQENYEIALAAAEKATNDYNVPQEVAIRGMTRLSAAVLGAGGNIHNATEAFLNTTVAIKGTAGSADDVKSAITAMVQIFSKGKVSAEELSGQLGERFPAAVTKFAKANNISTQELQKNLKDGTVGLDMLSKFITSLGTEYAPLALEIAKSNEEAGARAQIAMNKMKIAVGGSLKDVGAQFQIIGAELLTSLVPALTFVGEIAAKVFGALAGTVKFVIDNFHEFASVTAVVGGAMAAAAISAMKFKIALVAWDLKLVIAQIVKFIIGLKALTIAQIKANIAAYANPYVALAAGLTAAAIAAHRFATANDRLKAKLADGSATEEDVNKIFKRRLDIQKKITELEGNDDRRGKDTRAAKIAKLKEEYAALTEAIEDYRKSQNGSTEDLAKLKKEFEALLGGGDGGDSPFAKFAEELENFDDALQQVGVNGFKKLEDALVQFAETGKLAFKDLVSSIISDLTRLMIRQNITRPLFSMFTSLFNPAGSIGSQVGDNLAGHLGDMKLVKSAKGNTFASNGIVPYAKGGVIRKPTVSLMGEQGAEAILPLQRGRGGRLGVAMQGGGGGTTNVNYTGPTLNFNGDEYLPKSAVGDIISAAAARGESKTISSLKNSRGRRASLGL